MDFISINHLAFLGSLVSLLAACFITTWRFKLFFLFISLWWWGLWLTKIEGAEVWLFVILFSMPLIDMLKWHKSEKVKTTTSFKVWLYFCLGSLTVIYFYFDQQVHHTLLTLSFPVISQGDYDVASLIKSAKPELLAVIGFNFITGLVWFGLSKKVVLK